MIEIKAESREELFEQFTEKEIEIKRSVVCSVLDVLEGKADKAVFVMIMPQGIGLSIEKNEFLNALEKNIELFIKTDEFEMATQIKNWIDKIKNDPDILK